MALLVGAACGGGTSTVAPAGVPGSRPAACSRALGDAFTASAADSAWVYGFGAGALWRMPTGGGAAERLADASDNTRTDSLIADDRSLYWVEFGDQSPPVRAGRIWRANKTGGGGQALADSAMPVSLALDGADVFFTDRFGAVSRVPKSGGPAVALVTDSILADHVAGGTAVSGDYVYFVWSQKSEHRLRRVRREGGPVVDVAVLPSFSIWVAAANGAIVVGGGVESDGVVRSVSESTGAFGTIYDGAHANAFALDGGFVYVVTDARLVRVPEGGGEAVVLAESGGKTVAVTGGVAYFGALERTCP